MYRSICGERATVDRLTSPRTRRSGNGKGGAPGLRGSPFVTEAPADELAAVIRDHRRGERQFPELPTGAPSFREVPPEHMRGLVQYLKGPLQK